MAFHLEYLGRRVGQLAGIKIRRKLEFAYVYEPRPTYIRIATVSGKPVIHYWKQKSVLKTVSKFSIEFITLKDSICLPEAEIGIKHFMAEMHFTPKRLEYLATTYKSEALCYKLAMYVHRHRGSTRIVQCTRLVILECLWSRSNTWQSQKHTLDIFKCQHYEHGLKYIAFQKTFITPCKVVITSLLVRYEPLGVPASVKRVHCVIHKTMCYKLFVKLLKLEWVNEFWMFCIQPQSVRLLVLH